MNKRSKIITGSLILILIICVPALYSYGQNTATPAPQPMSLSMRAEIFWSHQKEVYEALGLTETQIQAIDEIINQERASCQPLLDDLKARLAAGTITLEEYQSLMKTRLSGHREVTLQKIEEIFTEEQAEMYPLILASLNK